MADLPEPRDRAVRNEPRDGRIRLTLLIGALASFGLIGGLSGLVVVLSIVAMLALHELGHFLVARWAGMQVTEFFVGFGPRLWSVRRGETTYGGQGHLPCRRLRPDHRYEQPRRRRSDRRAADLPPAVLPEADGRGPRRVGHPLRHRPVPASRGLRRRGDPRPRPVGSRRGGTRIDGRRRRRSSGRPDPVGGRGRDDTVRRVRHCCPIGARRPGGRGGPAGRRGDGPPGGDRGAGRCGRRGDRVLRVSERTDPWSRWVPSGRRARPWFASPT